MRFRVIFAAVLIVLAVAAVFAGSCGREIKGDVTKAEGAVLAVLSARGVADTDLLAREEEYWSRGGSRGKTVKYIFNAAEGFSLPGLEKDLRDSVKGMGGIRMDKVEYRAEKDGRGTVTYVFKRGKDAVVILAVKDVPAEWVKSASVASGSRSGMAPVLPKGGCLAIVLDDCGYSSKNLKTMKGMGVPLTLAVLPNTPYAKLADDFARKNNMEVILHLPMEPENPKEKLEKDTVKVSTEKGEIKDIIDRALKQCPSARGVSNHMGSKATKDDTVMRTVLADLGARGLYFLDSMTTAGSVSEPVCVELSVPRVERGVFIDNQNEERYMNGQIDKIESKVLAGESVVAVGHDRALTVKVLASRIPEMRKKGVRFVLVSEVVKAGSEKP